MMNIVFSPIIPYGELSNNTFDVADGSVMVYLHFHVPVFGITSSSLTIENGDVILFKVEEDNTYSYKIVAKKYGLVSVFLDEKVCSTDSGVLNPKSNLLYFDYPAPLVDQTDQRVFEPQREAVKVFEKRSKIIVNFGK